ncbi:MAG: adenylyl-sulfate kinase, partial [Proteobacteria bacterium]|nr:adenylyl-sulfate kinase [Pseudomonadota bacterium]
ADRRRILGHGAGVVWLTGLSGSGKSTIAHEVEKRLAERGVHSFVLDGDNVRDGLNADLGFTEGDRGENIRRISEVSRLFTLAGMVVLTAFISPFEKDRQKARSLFEEGEFFEVFVRCPLELCEARDPKRLYARARGGAIREFTGIDSPYEEPENPELILDTEKLSPDDCAERIIGMLEEAGIIKNE